MTTRRGLVWSAAAVLGIAQVAAALWLARRAPDLPSDTTFTRDVAPIVFAKCAGCHRPGQSGPFSLLTYRDVERHAEEIGEVVASRAMPPWLPARGYAEYVGDRSLSDEQIATLRRWIETGTKEGARKDLPKLPDWPEGWQLGTPDLILEMPEAYPVPASGPDLFRNFVLRTTLPESRWVRAIEFQPGNARTVHHAVITIDRTGAAAYHDRQDPGPGFDGVMSDDAEMPEGQWLAWVPGKRQLGVEGYPWRLDRGADLVLQLHLQTTGKPESARSKLGLYFAPGPPPRSPFLVPVQTRSIDLPAESSNVKVQAATQLATDVEVLGFWPHAHYLATDMQGYATLPDGTRRWLFHIPDWDFKWQDEFHFKTPLPLPKGSTLELEYTYDNSSANTRNPSRPPKHVRWGYQSKDEMAALHVHLLPRRPEDLAALKRGVAAEGLRQALADHEAILARDPEDLETLLSFAELRRAQQDQPAEALKLIEVALEKHPDWSRGTIELGFLHGLAGRNEAAIAAYQAALRIDPRSPQAHVNLGELLNRLGRTDEAIAQFEQALATGNVSAEMHSNLGAALMAKGRRAEAVAHFQAALELWPRYADAHYNLAAILGADGDAEGAMQHLRAALDVRPDFAQAHDNLGILLGLAGKTDEAIAELRAALAINPSLPGARENLLRALGPRAQLGLTVEEDASGLRVVAVVPGSAAEAMGIAPGDRVHAIQGAPATKLALARGVERTRLTGRPIELGITSHAGAERTVSIALGPLPTGPADR